MPERKKGRRSDAGKGGKKPRMRCEECGLVVVVEDPCSCASCDLICCGRPMKPC
ncbi:MAG: hypothetical protein ACUVV6_07895 [Thermoplasmatota archaeon]